MDIIAGILYMGGAVGFLILILHLLEKYAGISTYSTPRQGRDLRSTLNSQKTFVQAVSRDNPELYREAMKSVQKKKIASTHSNINTEIQKISKANPKLEKPIKLYHSPLSGKVIKSPEEEAIIEEMKAVSEKSEQLKQSVYYILYTKKEKDSDEKELEISDSYLKWKKEYDQNYDKFKELLSKYTEASKNGSMKDLLGGYNHL